MKAHFELMAAYDAWANRRLYAPAEELPETHHRGQVHTLLARLAGRAPALDPVYFQREG